MTVERCPVCSEAFSPKGLAIHTGMRHRPRRVDRINVETLWRAIEGMGVIESGTWVSFRHEDAETIAAEYDRLRAER